jgi:ABC-type transport system involved in cytochrome bd biosynthesis fused ATPase/permease subunit
MRKGITRVLLLGLVASVGLLASVQAQARKDAATKLDRIDGTVTDVRTDKSEFMVRQSKTNNVVWTIAFTADTKFTYRNAEAKVEDVKTGRRVICLGKFGTEKSTMTAARVDVRSGK